MRITAETKETTRRKILETAQTLFRTAGFEVTTTREIAKAAGIATGTLFNYFPTKEAIVATLVVDSLSRLAHKTSDESFESLEESLFAHVAAGLRVLKPYRKYLAPVLETALSPLAAAHRDDFGSTLRTGHLEQVVLSVRQYQLEAALTPVALHLYWTLYLGVLAFWTTDTSSKQEETLALLDQSLEMFVGWLRAGHEASNESPIPTEGET